MRIVVSSVVLAILAAVSATAAPITGQRFSSEVTVDAPLPKVFAALSDAATAAKVLHMDTKATTKLAKVGDSIRVTDSGDPGALVVTTFVPGAELRLQLDPDNGTYICQERFTLVPAGKGTKVTLEVRYTESGPQKPEDLAKQAKQLDEGLAALKAIVEAKAGAKAPAPAAAPK